jgi:hypothetical protein
MSLSLASLCSIEQRHPFVPTPIGRASRAAAVKDAVREAAAPATPARSVLDRASTVLTSERGAIAPRHCAAAAWRQHLPAPIDNRNVTFPDPGNGCFLAALPAQRPVRQPPFPELQRPPLWGSSAGLPPHSFRLIIGGGSSPRAYAQPARGSSDLPKLGSKEIFEWTRRHRGQVQILPAETFAEFQTPAYASVRLVGWRLGDAPRNPR